MTSEPAAVAPENGPMIPPPYSILDILHTYSRRYSGNCWAAKQPAELSCTNHSSTSAYIYRHESLRSCDVYKSFSRPVLFKTAVKGTIKVGGPSTAGGAPRGSPVATKTRGGELVIKRRRALATTTSRAMRFLEHGIKTMHSYAATCHQIDCHGLAQWD